MKVIATTQEGYILEAGRDEVANLMGMYSSYSDGFRIPSIGDDINIEGLYEKYRAAERIRNEKASLDGIINMLQRAAADVEPFIVKKEAGHE